MADQKVDQRAAEKVHLLVDRWGHQMAAGLVERWAT